MRVKDPFASRNSLDPDTSSERESEAGPTPQESELLALSLEDRLFVALCKRGSQRIGQFIESARRDAGHGFCVEDEDCLFSFDDDQLVVALEQYADRISE